MPAARPVLVLATATFCLGAPVFAQEDDLTPTETIELLEKVEGIGDTLHEKRFGVHAISITAFREGTTSPTAAYEFYLKCYKLVNFERREARESEFRDWRSKNVKWLRANEHAETRRLQLSFLVMTLRAAQIKKPEDRYELGTELLGLADVCIAHYADAGRHRRIFHEGAVGSIYGQAYDLANTLRGFSDWPSAPLDLEGIYDNVVLPPYRTPKKAAELATLWDRRMAQEVRLISALEDVEREKEFTETVLPRLRWRKHVELIAAGQRRTSVMAMVEMVQKHLDHPDADNWLAALKAYLAGERDLPDYGPGSEQE